MGTQFGKRAHQQTSMALRVDSSKTADWPTKERTLNLGPWKMDVPLKLRSKASLRMSLGWKPSGKLDDTWM